MPYDANGRWKEEDDTVQAQLTGLLAPDNPFVMGAKTRAATAANKRGLTNSSIAVGAGEKAAIETVTPIAAQTASQIYNKNLSAQGARQTADLQNTQIESTERMQGRDIAAQNERLAAQLGSTERLAAAQNAAEKERLGMSLSSEEKRAADDLKAAMERLNVSTASSERMQATDIAAQNARLAEQLGSNERLAAAQQASEKERLGMSLTSEEKRASDDLNAAKERLGIQVAANTAQYTAQITSQEKQQQLEIQAQNDRLAQQLGSNERLQAAQQAFEKQQQGEKLSADEAAQVRDLTSAKERLQAQLDNQSTIAALDANVKQAMAGLDRATQERIASMNIAADEKKSVISQAIMVSSNYAAEFQAIAANDKIPANVRDSYLAHIASQRDTDLSIIEQVSQRDLDWGTAGFAPVLAGSAVNTGFSTTPQAPVAVTGAGFR